MNVKTLENQHGSKIMAMATLFVLMLILSLFVMAGFETKAMADGVYLTRIVWATDRDGNWEIYIMDEDGTNQTRLTFDPPGTPYPYIIDQHPVFTSDNSRIVWSRGGTIWIMNVDGSGKTQLTFNPYSYDNHPYVNPWDTKIYFNSRIAGATVVMRMNLNGSGVEQLTDTTKNRYHPTVRADGLVDGLILYAVDVDFDGIGEYAATFNISTSVETVIWGAGVGLDPVWGTTTWKVTVGGWRGPLGTKIVLADDPDGDNKYRLIILNPDGTFDIQLTDGQYNDITPYFRYPGGIRIVFVRGTPPTEIYRINEDGTGILNLTNDPEGDTFFVTDGPWPRPVPVSPNWYALVAAVIAAGGLGYLIWRRWPKRA